MQESILSPFPTNIDSYSADVAPIVDYVISRYGRDEWRAAVLTNELHGHLGIYATIGVKMGILAREKLGKPHHTKVISFAGNTPPISCMNDGLQVSTGATIGHGLITIDATTEAYPGAIFIELKLKDKYADIIANDIRHGIETYGQLSPKYWAYVRHLAIEYWQAFDRNEIFDVVLGQ